MVIKRELILNRKQSNMSDSRSPRSYDGGDHYIVQNMLHEGDIQRMSTEQDEDNNHPYLPPPPGEPPSSYYRDESP